MNTDTIIEKYISLRDKRAEKKKAFEEKDEEFKTAMERLEALLATRMNDAGTTTLKCAEGTAYKEIVVKPSCMDGNWTDLWAWLRENNRLDMLEKRLLSTAVKEYITENGEPPPFVRIEQEEKVRIRRA